MPKKQIYGEKIILKQQIRVILNNLGNINAELIAMKIPQRERLVRLNAVARKQMDILNNNNQIKHYLNY